MKKKLKISATSEGAQKAELTLIRLGFKTKTGFADSTLISRNVVTNFFLGREIQVDSFEKICEKLTLDWKEIAGLIVEESLTPVATPVEKSSEVNSEQMHLYAELENMLRSKNWEEADQVTSEIIWELAGKSEKPSFQADVSPKLPCEVLCTIDALWTKYSDGRFGFSVQRSIWQSSKVNKDIVEFTNHVGWTDWWKENGKDVFGFVPVENFSDDALKEGQLPWLVTWKGGSRGMHDRKAYLSKIVRCRI